MMNALPLPTGPMDIPGGSVKTDRTLPHSDRCGRPQERESFASTLRAAHDNSRMKKDACRSTADETSEDLKAGRSKEPQTSTAVDKRSPNEKEEPGQAMPVPVIPPDNRQEATAPTELATDNGEACVTGQPEKGHRGETLIASPSGAESVEKAQEKSMTAGISPVEASTQKTASAGSETATLPKEAHEVASSTAIEPSAEDHRQATTASKATHNLARTRSDFPDPMNPPGKDLTDKESTDAVQRVLRNEAGEKSFQTENNRSKEDDYADKNALSKTGRLSKLVHSRLDSSSGDGSRDASEQNSAPENQTNTALRATTGQTPARLSEASGEVVHETPPTAPNDTKAQMVDRQVLNDSTPSFSNAAATARTATVSSGANAPTTMTAATEQFHRDNFNQLVERAIFTVRGEQSEARIALKPDHLGHVQMRVATEHHMVHIKIITESPVARDLIDAHAHQLKSELQQQGLTVEHIEVSVSDGQGDAYRGERQRESFLRQLASQNPTKREEDTHPPPHGARQRTTGQSPSRGIDYFA